MAALGLAAAVIVLAATLPDSALTGLLLGVTVLLVAPGYALLLGAALESIPASMAARTTAWLVAVGSAGGSVVAFVVAATVGADPVPVLLSVGGLLAVCALLAALFGRRTLR